MSGEPQPLVPRQLRPGFDRLLLAPALAVLFRDSFDQRVVADGLRVELADPATGRAQELAANGQGVFVAHHLPRIRMAEAGDSPACTRPFDLRLRDLLGRFLPLRLQPELPAPGLLDPGPGASPPQLLPFIPLYSAPTRALGTGLGLLRAQLRLASHPERAASWARLELWCEGMRLGEGVADGDGQILLPCRLPPPREPPLAGSPPQPETSFERNRWDVDLRAYWDPALAAQAIPELHALQAQPEVPLLQDLASPAVPLAPLVLGAGETLVARSDGSSFLFVGA